MNGHSRLASAFAAFGLAWAPLYAGTAAILLKPSFWALIGIVILVITMVIVNLLASYTCTNRILKMLLHENKDSYQGCYFSPISPAVHLSPTAIAEFQAGRHRLVALAVTPSTPRAQEIAGPRMYPVFGGTPSTLFLPHWPNGPTDLDVFVLHHEVGHGSMLSRFTSLESEMGVCNVVLLASLWCTSFMSFGSPTLAAISLFIFLLYALARLTRCLDRERLSLSHESMADVFALNHCRRFKDFPTMIEEYRILLTYQKRLRRSSLDRRIEEFDRNVRRVIQGENVPVNPFYPLKEAIFLGVVAVAFGCALPSIHALSLLLMLIPVAIFLVTLKVQIRTFEKLTAEIERVIGVRVKKNS